MDIAIPLFDGLTALDAIGPFEVLSRLPGARVRFVALAPGPYRTDNRQLAIEYDPEPPFSAGSPRMAPPPVVDALRERMRARIEAWAGGAGARA